MSRLREYLGLAGYIVTYLLYLSIGYGAALLVWNLPLPDVLRIAAAALIAIATTVVGFTSALLALAVLIVDASDLDEKPSSPPAYQPAPPDPTPEGFVNNDVVKAGVTAYFQAPARVHSSIGDFVEHILLAGFAEHIRQTTDPDRAGNHERA